MKKLCTLCLALYCLALSAGNGFLLPDIISNNMVLQQQTGVRLWGKASPGSVVSVKGDWSGEAVSVKVAGQYLDREVTYASCLYAKTYTLATSVMSVTALPIRCSTTHTA